MGKRFSTEFTEAIKDIGVDMLQTMKDEDDSCLVTIFVGGSDYIHVSVDNNEHYRRIGGVWSEGL